MPMETQEIERLIKARFPDAIVEIRDLVQHRVERPGGLRGRLGQGGVGDDFQR